MKPKLYLLTDESPLPCLLVKLEQILSTQQIAILQIRRKNTLPSLLYQESVQIMEVAQRFGVQVLVNDDMNLAARLGVGVHLGQGDGSLLKARQILGSKLIGRTCHNRLDLVAQSMSDGVDYAAMGAMFGSSTKPNACQVALSDDDCQRLLDLRQKGLRLCVIGGITLDNVHLLKQRLPIVPDYIAVTADIMGRPLDELVGHCQKWQGALQNF